MGPGPWTWSWVPGPGGRCRIPGSWALGRKTRALGPRVIVYDSWGRAGRPWVHWEVLGPEIPTLFLSATAAGLRDSRPGGTSPGIAVAIPGDAKELIPVAGEMHGVPLGGLRGVSSSLRYLTPVRLCDRAAL